MERSNYIALLLTRVVDAAMEEIIRMEGSLGAKEGAVRDAEAEVISIKSEVVIQKRPLLSYGRDSEESSIIQVRS